MLDGSVRKAGNRVRISVQLVNVADGYHLWSETYDRTLDDIFAVQDDIAQSVVKELRTTLLGEEADSEASGEAKAEVAAAAAGAAPTPRRTGSTCRPASCPSGGRAEPLAKAEDYLLRALELEPEFARAWAGLADVLFDQVGLGREAGRGRRCRRRARRWPARSRWRPTCPRRSRRRPDSRRTTTGTGPRPRPPSSACSRWPRTVPAR